jgi:hypothetical protein
MSAVALERQRKTPRLRRFSCALTGRPRRGLYISLRNAMHRMSAASVVSQFPVDPRYVGPRAGRLRR